MTIPAREKTAPPETKRFQDCSVTDLNRAITLQKSTAASLPSADRPGPTTPLPQRSLLLTHSFQSETIEAAFPLTSAKTLAVARAGAGDEAPSWHGAAQPD